MFGQYTCGDKCRLAPLPCIGLTLSATAVDTALSIPVGQHCPWLNLHRAPLLTLLILRSPSTILGSSLGWRGSVAIFTTLQGGERTAQGV